MQRDPAASTTRDFPSTLEAAYEVETALLAACAQMGYPEDDIFAIRLALHEALVNAVKHGNKLDLAKHVRVRYCLTPVALQVSVEDQGAGFNPEALPDPTLDENLELPSGRGVLLMRAYMDEVTFNAAGNVVTMVKQNSGAMAVREP